MNVNEKISGLLPPVGSLVEWDVGEVVFALAYAVVSGQTSASRPPMSELVRNAVEGK